MIRSETYATLSRMLTPPPLGGTVNSVRNSRGSTYQTRMVPSLLAVVTELDRADRAGVAGQQGQLKLAGDVPDARRSVLVSSHDLPSVRAECGVSGLRPVCGEGRYDLAGGDAVYDYAAVTISSDYLAAVGAELGGKSDF